MITRRSFVSAAGCLALGSKLLSRASADQSLATNRLIYGYPPGASGSKLATALLPLLAASGGPVLQLDNVEGKNTRAASITAAQAIPDGATLLQAISGSLTLMPFLYRNMGFGPERDFKPVAALGDFPYGLVVGPIVPASVTNLSQYLAWLAENPEYRNIGISIHGSVGELAVRAVARGTGSPLHSQAYQGTDDMLTDLNNKNLPAAFVVPNRAISLNPSAPIRAIGVTSAQRFKHWPQVATLSEQGVVGLDLTAWFGWFTQAATPEKKLEVLRASVKKMQASTEYAAILNGLLLVPNVLDCDQIMMRMMKERAQYKAMVQALGIKKLD